MAVPIFSIRFRPSNSAGEAWRLLATACNAASAVSQTTHAEMFIFARGRKVAAKCAEA